LRKHLSVLALSARGSVYKALLLMLVMAGAEITAFYLSMQRMLRQELPTLEATFTRSRISWICAGAFFLLTLLLALHTCSFSAKTGYTLKRLSVSERAITLWQTAWHVICYTLFWAVQLLLALGLGLWYVHAAPADAVSGQTIFLAFHRLDFLFALMPMQLVTRWVRNILFLITISFTAACFSYRQRRRKLPLTAALQTGLVIFFFSVSMTDSSADSLAIVLTLGVLFAAAVNFLAKEDDSHEKALS